MGRRAGNFADLPADKRAKLGSRGGKSAQASGTAHQWTPEEARAAGRKSGRVRKTIKPGRRKRAVRRSR